MNTLKSMINGSNRTVLSCTLWRLIKSNIVFWVHEIWNWIIIFYLNIRFWTSSFNLWLKHFNHTAMLLLVFHLRRAWYLKLDMHTCASHTYGDLYIWFVHTQQMPYWMVCTSQMWNYIIRLYPEVYSGGKYNLCKLMCDLLVSIYMGGFKYDKL